MRTGQKRSCDSMDATPTSPPEPNPRGAANRGAEGAAAAPSPVFKRPRPLSPRGPLAQLPAGGMSFLQLPLDIIDGIASLLPDHDVLNLAAANRQLHAATLASRRDSIMLTQSVLRSPSVRSQAQLLECIAALPHSQIKVRPLCASIRRLDVAHCADRFIPFDALLESAKSLLPPHRAVVLDRLACAIASLAEDDRWAAFEGVYAQVCSLAPFYRGAALGKLAPWFVTVPERLKLQTMQCLMRAAAPLAWDQRAAVAAELARLDQLGLADRKPAFDFLLNQTWHLPPCKRSTLVRKLIAQCRELPPRFWFNTVDSLFDVVAGLPAAEKKQAIDDLSFLALQTSCDRARHIYEVLASLGKLAPGDRSAPLLGLTGAIVKLTPAMREPIFNDLVDAGHALPSTARAKQLCELAATLSFFSPTNAVLAFNRLVHACHQLPPMTCLDVLERVMDRLDCLPAEGRFNALHGVLQATAHFSQAMSGSVRDRCLRLLGENMRR